MKVVRREMQPSVTGGEVFKLLLLSLVTAFVALCYFSVKNKKETGNWTPRLHQMAPCGVDEKFEALVKISKDNDQNFMTLQ